MKDLQEEYGISPAVGVILLLGITAALATIAGIVLLDIGDGLSQNAQAGVEVNETTEGVEVIWTTDNNAERIIVQVDGQRYTLNSVNDSITLGLNEGSNVSVIGVIDGEESVISETTTESDTGNGEVTDYETTDTNTVSGKVSINPDIPGATVKSIQYGNVLDSTTTDSSGNYTIETTEESTLYYIVSGFEYNSSDLYASTKRQPNFDSDVNVDFDETEIETVDTGSETVSVINTAQNGVITIGSIYELQAFDTEVSDDYELVSDIDASGTSSWNNGNGFDPIEDPDGYYGAENYQGTFDGNGYEISNVTIDNSGESERAAIFEFYAGNIKNLTITGFDFTGSEYGSGGLVGVHTGEDVTLSNIEVKNISISSTSSEVGSLIGFNDYLTTVENVTVSNPSVDSTGWSGGLVGYTGLMKLSNVSIEGGSISADSIAGGVIGELYALTDLDATDNVTSSAEVTSEGETAGGLIGKVSPDDHERTVTIKNASATGNVTGSGYSLGGLVGLNLGESVYENVFATGDITNNRTSSDSTVGGETGGLIGELDESVVRDSYATGNVVVENNGEANGVGGLVGSIAGSTLENVYAEGDVTATGSEAGAGGLVGDGTVKYSQITDSYATGDVTGGVGEPTGGLGGDIYNTDISNSYATGDVTSTSEQTGGLIGYFDENISDERTIQNVYATGSVEGTNKVGGLIGELNVGKLQDSYYKNTAQGVTGDNYVGGLIGDVMFEQEENLESSYVAAPVSGSSNMGGVVGGVENGTDGVDYQSKTTGAYWDSDVGPNTTFGNATSLTTSEMQGSSASSNMTTFDFDSTWNTTDQYPELQNISE